MQIDGSVQLKRWRWRKRTACCGMTWGCLTLTAFVLLLLLTEALLLFFLIPREPCVRFDSASPRFVTVNANSLSVNAFRYDFRLLFDNPNYVSLGVHNLDLEVYYYRTDRRVGRVLQPSTIDLSARKSGQRKTLEVEFNQNAQTALAAADMALEYATTRTITLRVNGTAQPRYIGRTLPTMPLDFIMQVKDP